MGRIYNICLNSTKAINYVNTRANNCNLNYFFDFTVLPNLKKFKLSYSFVSMGSNVTSQTDIVQIYMDIGQTNNFLASGVGTSAESHKLIGFAYPNYLQSGGNIFSYFSCTNSDNNPIYLDNTPYANQINVQISNIAGVSTNYVDNAGNPIGNYVLNLCLEDVTDD